MEREWPWRGFILNASVEELIIEQKQLELELNTLTEPSLESKLIFDLRYVIAMLESRRKTIAIESKF